MNPSHFVFLCRDFRVLAAGILLAFGLGFPHARGQITIVLPDTEDLVADPESLVESPHQGSHASSSKTTVDTLTFLTGDQLSGKFLGIDRDEGIRFHHPDAESPILFALKNLHELTFAHAPIPEISESLIMAQLTNGDRISGNVIRMDGEHLILKTRYAGEVNILRSALTRLLPASSGHLLYAGPGEKSDWVFQNTGHANTWVFRDGVMRSDGAQGGVGRKLPALPEQFKIDMDLAWRGMPYIQISLMSQDARNPHSGSWTLMIHGENFRMYRQGGIGHLDMGNVQVAGFNAKQKSKLSIRVDKPEKRITLLVDDVQAHQWQDPNGFQAGGENLIFQAQQSMPYAISNLTVSVWDGKNTPASASAETSDILELVNGDRISGKLLRIDGQTLKFQNDFTAFDLPLNRVASVNFDKSRQTSARLQQSDVEARIFGGDRLTLALASLSPEQLAGDSENLGHVRVKSPHLERLHFNLYDPRKKTLGEDSDF